jgi:4-diphosphocytidyl-2-C-methyl-D-erythritol kinase
MLGVACAKLNLSLRVGRTRDDGFHALHGLFQSFDLHDRLVITPSDEDSIVGFNGSPVPDGDANSAMQAAAMVRVEAGSSQPFAIELAKRIPTAAGLGGGSADAAASLAAVGRMLGVETSSLTRLAPDLGSDVPFCFRGGTALVSGRGETVEARSFAAGFAVALVVPPAELSTPVVYRQWDRLGGPEGPALPTAALPPSLRGYEPLANDLYPAAVTVAPIVAEWRDELAARWGTPVIMSGSGPSLFAFFGDGSEAQEALGVVPAGARAVHAGVPIPFGWVLADDDVVVDSTGRQWGETDAELRSWFRLGA